MEISLKAPLLKRLVEQNKDNYYLKIDGWRMMARLKQPIGFKPKEDDKDTDSGFEENDSFKFSLEDVKDSELSGLVKALEGIKAPSKTVETVKRWIEVLKDPANGDIGSVQGIEKVLAKLLSKSPNKWLLYKGEDGMMNPVLINDTVYHAPSHGDYASYQVEVIYGYLFPEKENESKGYCVKKESFSWNKYDICREDEDDVPDYLKAYNEGGSSKDEDEDEELIDDDDSSKKAKKPVKKKTIKLSALLALRGLYIPTKRDILFYDEDMKLQAKIAAQIGVQYTVNSEAYRLHENEYRDLSFNLVDMTEDDVPNKVIVDSVISTKEITRSATTKKYQSRPLPYHPYVRGYDITKYRTVAVHVSKMQKYEFNPRLMDSLILPEADKALLNALIAGEVTFDDIIAGKSGGIIILGSGDAGTGKTLTAEVLSEVVGKPLYQVQSAQLGLTPEQIEKNLYAILKRADKWKALLLIDECDAYVSERGDKMVQNAVVGVFLRLFEYYKGILFLTTNRHDKIDQAIISRCTAHIKYGIPTKASQIKIFDVISKGYKIIADKVEVEKILDKYPHMVGRDIRNLLKLLKKFNHKEKGEFELKADMLKAVEQFIPFVNKTTTKVFNPSVEIQKTIDQLAGVFYDLNYDEDSLVAFLHNKKGYEEQFVNAVVASYKELIRSGKKR